MPSNNQDRELHVVPSNNQDRELHVVPSNNQNRALVPSTEPEKVHTHSASTLW